MPAAIMFEIYRDSRVHNYRVVYFTELGEYDKDREITRALEGEHVYDGYIATSRTEARQVINEIVARLNAGEALAAEAIAARLLPFAEPGSA